MATQPNGPAFTSLGQKSVCSPSISFTPVGQNRSMDKSLVVSYDKHTHKPQLPQPKIPSQNQESPEDVPGSLPNNQSPTVSGNSNPSFLLHGESPCPQPGLGKVTGLANNWVSKPNLVPCISSSKTPNLSFDPLEEEMPHLHKGIPDIELSLPSLDQFESCTKDQLGRLKHSQKLGLQKSPSPYNNATCINVIDILGDSQPSLHFTGTDIIDSPSDNPCSPSTQLERESILQVIQSCPGISQDKITGSTSSSMCPHVVPYASHDACR